MTKPRALNGEQRRFIVVRLACFETPTEVAVAVKEEFGIELDRRTVAHYSPERAGADTGKAWRRLFDETRRTYLEDLSSVFIAQQNYRLRQLQKLFDRAKARGADKLAADYLRQAAEEVGGAFTNARALTGPNGVPLAAPALNIILESEDQARRALTLLGTRKAE